MKQEKKIGILTFNRAINYGAQLQCFALFHALKEFKKDVFVLDYRCQEIEQSYSGVNSFKSLLKSAARTILHPVYARKNAIRKKRFKNFSKHKYELSKKYTSNNFQDIDKDFGCVVVGSDQVWNPRITGSDCNYFLPTLKNVKKISYAASFGTNNSLPFSSSRAREYDMFPRVLRA